MTEKNSNNTENPTLQDCQEWKNKYEKCMKETSGKFDQCMPLLTQTFWCGLDIKKNS